MKVDRLLKDVGGPYQCYALASRRGARYLARLYEHHFAPTGLTSSQFSILSLLAHEPDLTVVELAKAMEMERTTMVRTLKPLKDAGLIEECANRRGRAAMLHNTPLGFAKIKEAQPHWQAAQRTFEDHAGQEVAARLRDTLLTIVPDQND